MWLGELGRGVSIREICTAQGWTEEEFHSRWNQAVTSRVPPVDGSMKGGVSRAATIERDSLGIPHIFAETDNDLFWAFGFAMAQDRMFQLDYLRRKALGTLAEVIGRDAVQTDLVARTVGLHRIAKQEWATLEDEPRALVTAFTSGINEYLQTYSNNLPIEFELLEYVPTPWEPIDCLAIEGEFRWYLTGRLPVIAIPELAKRRLGSGPLLDEFLLGEADEEAILHPGEYSPLPPSPDLESVGQAINDPDGAVGSNNWVVGPQRTATGAAFVASDPHIAFEAVSCWYEVHLCGGSFNVAGMTYAGMPAVMFGRNERVAWGITNNICSQRDLFVEKVSADHPDCFLFNEQWEPGRECVEAIAVKGEPAIEKTIRFSRNGPIVNELLPDGIAETSPVSLKWLGAYQGGWLTSLLAIDRAANVTQLESSLRPWHVPTFSLVFADVEGNIGFKTSGRVPVRSPVQGYRSGWDPDHQWSGLTPFEAMPGVLNPDRGWVATANNRVAADDFPYPLTGCWSSGWRARRIRRLIEIDNRHSLESMGRIQQDVMSLRGAECCPALLAALSVREGSHCQEAVDALTNWDFQVTNDSVAATIFNVFFTHWCQAVSEARFEPPEVALVKGAIGGCAARLLRQDQHGWFGQVDRLQVIADCFQATIDELVESLSDVVADWHWGRLHTMPLRHVLASRGDLGILLNHGGAGVRGDMATICNSGSGDRWSAATGAGYRMLVDMSVTPPVLHAVDAQSQSGAPGSAHYSDQYASWLEGQHHTIPLDPAEAHQAAVCCLQIEPHS
jgi:penicillin G amidase